MNVENVKYLTSLLLTSLSCQIHKESYKLPQFFVELYNTVSGLFFHIAHRKSVRTTNSNSALESLVLLFCIIPH